MKKQKDTIKDTIFIALCILFAVFLSGVFIGRATSRYPIDLTRADDGSFTASKSDSKDLFIGKKMNINVASVEDLTLIPSIGEATAQIIVDYRTEHGSFQSLSELGDVEGLGSDRILQLIDYITVGGTYEDTGR